MNSNTKTARKLEDAKINVKMKLSALWAAVMFCYIYGDWITLFVPGFLEEVIAGIFGPLGPTTQWKLFGTAVFIAIPAVMVFLSLTLRPTVNRWVNIIFGTAYIIPVLIVLFMGPWAYFIFLSLIEVVLKVLIVWYAWTWPTARGA